MKTNITKKTIEVEIDWLWIWWSNPIRIQSMTNTPTSDIGQTVEQIKQLVIAWSELVRITVNDDNAAKAVSKIIEILKTDWITVPIVWDFHFNGHILLEKYPDMARALSKYRINPGNVGTWNKRDENFEKIITCAIKYDKAVRIWINWWSLDPDLLNNNIEANAKLKNPKNYNEVFIKSIVDSAIISSKKAEQYWLKKNKIILSVKVSNIQEMIKANEILSSKVNYPLHLWLTEAWWWVKWIVSSSSALSILLQQWIWNTIRVSITPEPWQKRSLEVDVCKYLLQTMWFRNFQPLLTSCPWCWRTSSNNFQKLSKKVSDEIIIKLPGWKKKYEWFESTNIAIMWCIVNGPWESKNSDIWISFPGNQEWSKLPVYIRWKFYKNLEWDNVFHDFINIIEEYFDRHYKKNL